MNLNFKGKLINDRYDNKGDITFNQIYYDNLYSNSSIFNKKLGDLKKKSIIV